MTAHETDRPTDLGPAEDNDDVDDNDAPAAERHEDDTDVDYEADASAEPEGQDADVPADTVQGDVPDDDDRGDDESVLLTESSPGSVLPPEDEAVGESEMIETSTAEVDEAAEPSPLERLEPVGPDTPIDPGTGSYHDRWSAIQASFIDDPRRAVETASSLLAEMWHAIDRSVVDERHAIDSRWQNAERSTDELRVAMQDYRDLYSRLGRLSPT